MPQHSLEELQASAKCVRRAIVEMTGAAKSEHPGFDAFLYLGRPSGMKIAQLSRVLCSDRASMEMRLRRLALIPPPPGAPFNPVDRRKEYCALPEGSTETPDREPDITESIHQAVREAALGKVDPARIAPECRERLIAFLKDNGLRLLRPLEAIESLTLLTDARLGGKCIRRCLQKRPAADSGSLPAEPAQPRKACRPRRESGELADFTPRVPGETDRRPA